MKKECNNCYYCMGRSKHDCICEIDEKVYPKTHICDNWKNNNS